MFPHDIHVRRFLLCGLLSVFESPGTADHWISFVCACYCTLGRVFRPYNLANLVLSWILEA